LLNMILWCAAQRYEAVRPKKPLLAKNYFLIWGNCS
jgi:hypothetical protein